MKIRDGKTRLFILLFILPALIIYTMFQIIPLFGAVYFSLSEWNGIAGSAIEFVGFKNFANIFKDANFILSLKNMAKMVIFSVLFHTPIALLMAVGIYSAKRGGRLFKAIYFVPTVFPLTAVGLLWYFIFMPNGSLNSLLEVVGLKDLVTLWLVNEKTAMNTIIFVNIWAGLGYYMVILLAGLSTISNDVYEAAAVDGVNPVTKFFYITVPLLKPIIKMCILMDIIGTIKVFDLVFVMTEGGPNGLTNLPTTLMYQEAFKYDHYGTGSAICIILLIICLIGTLCGELLGSKKES